MPSPTSPGHHHETDYDRRRLRQWLAGEARADGVTRRRLLTLLAATAAGTALGTTRPARAADGVVKPLPPEWFIERGTNAETRWEALRGTGHHTPNERFFVRNHTATPVLEADDWRLRLWGSGLRGTPGEDRSVEFGYDDLRALPAVTHTAFVECAGNGRSYPQGGSAPLTRQATKSAFELASGATFTAGQRHVLHGRSWSGAGAVARVDVSTDGGANWRPARLHDRPRAGTWTRWSLGWQPYAPGATHLLARATDTPAVLSRTSPWPTHSAICSTRWCDFR